MLQKSFWQDRQPRDRKVIVFCHFWVMWLPKLTDLRRFDLAQTVICLHENRLVTCTCLNFTEEELELQYKRTLDIPKEKKCVKLSGPHQQLKLTLNHPCGYILMQTNLPQAIVTAIFHGHHNCKWKFLSLTRAKKLLSLH